jgi:hypothetical protein
LGKQPAIQWYTGDWLKDPDVSKCSPATRGVWFDAINAMASSDRSGSLSGTYDQLARICRCTESEMRSAVDEMRTTNAATIRDRNGVVTLINRRMQNEHLQRLATRKRVQRFRHPGDVTPMKRKRNAPSSSSSSISSSEKEVAAVPPADVKPRKKPTGEHHELIDHWCQAWERRYGRQFPFQAQAGRNAKTIKTLLDSLGFTEATAAMDRYLACDDGFLNGHPLGMLLSQLSKFVVDPPDDPDAVGPDGLCPATRA